MPMSLRGSIQHITSYQYSRPITLGPQTIRLKPSVHARTKVHHYGLDISPKEHFLRWHSDLHGNQVATLTCPNPTAHLKIQVNIDLSLSPTNPFDFFIEPEYRELPMQYHKTQQAALSAYLETSEEMASLLSALSLEYTPGMLVMDFLRLCNQRLHQQIDYHTRLEPGIQSPKETLHKKSGACRDMAWCLCHVLRHAGFATRFVSGYLVHLQSVEFPHLKDGVELHAWCEVFLPGGGWIGLDPTSGLFTAESHIPLCHAPTPFETAPIAGTIEAVEQSFDYEMHFTRAKNQPLDLSRDLPYQKQEWQQITHLAKHIDDRLKPLQLTQGGEPTFVLAAPSEDAAWDYLADSPGKFEKALQWAKNLQKTLCPHGLLQVATGKQYPGEPHPRWAIHLYWRADQTALSHHLCAIQGSVDENALQAFGKAFSERRENRILSMSIEDQRLVIHLPKYPHCDAFLADIALIDALSHRHQIPIRLAGQAAPIDSSLCRLSIVPDPGVLEVNLPIATEWGELAAWSQLLYDTAEAQGLSPQRFWSNGLPNGSGGGNHIVVGGHSADSNPFYRHPQLLESLVRFWQHHPALSYAFAGLSVGTDSQSPRLDEGRSEILHELELSCQQLRHAPLLTPMLIQQLFGHVLVDVTGNSHRSEICIDKLCNPQLPNGEMGLIELRAFEMPPHPQMHALLHLLVRGCLARFATTAFQEAFIDFGHRLHDEFMLPHFLEIDLANILYELNAHGQTWDLQWFRPLLESRFPIYGRIDIDEVELTLQMALEPWPVLDGGLCAQATSRPLDCATERLQITVKNLAGHHTLLCNGVKVPLHPSPSDPQLSIAGIRYKAHALPITRHPTMPVHTPLTLMLWDHQRQVPLGGCRYYRDNPSGYNTHQRPMNLRESQCRLERCVEPYWAGHVYMHPIKTENLGYTLDLRQWIPYPKTKKIKQTNPELYTKTSLYAQQKT